MPYFNTCTNLEELKKEFRRLCMIHHPDRGGDTATMAAINDEYDRVFPRLKLAHNKTAQQPTHETAESTRSEFYTSNGWNGSKYDVNRSTKDCAAEIREYVKKVYPDCKFSIRTHYASMCSSITVELVSGPYEALKDSKTRHDVNYFYIDRDEVLTDWARAVMIDVNDRINQYRHSDCDSMIDYFDVNFYYDLGVGRYDKPYTISTKAKKIDPAKQQTPATVENTQQEAHAQQAAPALRVAVDPEYNSIEVYFTDKPAAEVREALKAGGWRWHHKKACWYNRNSEDNFQALRRITEAAPAIPA